MNDYLMHYGVKNQQWGERRYQNEDGTWTELGKERRRQGEGGGRSVSKSVSSYLKRRKEQRVIKREEKRKAEEEERRKMKEMADAEAAKLRAEREKKIEDAKKEAIASGDVNEIRKYAHLMTTKELEDAQKRTDYLDKILKSNTKLTKLDKIEKIVKKGTSYINTINDAKKALNTLFPKDDKKTSSTKSNPNLLDLADSKNKQDTTKAQKESKKENKNKENKYESSSDASNTDKTKPSKEEKASTTEKDSGEYTFKTSKDDSMTIHLRSPKVEKGGAYSSEGMLKTIGEHFTQKYKDEKISDVESGSRPSSYSYKDTESVLGSMYELKDIKLDDILKKKGS